MTETTDAQAADVKFYLGNDAITNLIKEARSLRRNGQDNRLRQGGVYCKLRTEVERYGRNNKGLSYQQAVGQTGVPWSTAERFRQMFELVTELTIPGDVFLILCEEGANIAEIKTALGATFGASIKALLQQIQSLDVADGKAVADVADKLKKLISRAPAESDLETLQGDLDTLLAELPTVKGAVESVDLAEAIHQKQVEISESYAKPMRALVNALAPFVNWSPQKVKDYMTAFEEQPLSSKTKVFNAATKFASDMATDIAIVKEAEQ
jgi:hypothetical protein